MTNLLAERKQAVHLLRVGYSIPEVAAALERTPCWVRKWQQRHNAEGWAGLQGRSRRPHQCPTQLSVEVQQAIRQARSELEAEAETGVGLKYIGSPAIRTRLRAKDVAPLPSVATIERVLRTAGMTRPYQRLVQDPPHYPHLCPTQPQELHQVDIVPHYLQGGARVACFNAIDVVSRYPTGQAYPQRRAQDAEAFLIHVWQTLGLATYTQMDNEGCFSGGFTHPYVLGRVVRLALQVGTEVVFSPTYHPQSNGSVERFHQDYDQHVWEATYLENRAAVNDKGAQFFGLYRQRPHPQLQAHTPAQVHARATPVRLPAAFPVASQKRPLHAGQVHFMRLVSPAHQVAVLNVKWTVRQATPGQGVWVTLTLQPRGAKLRIYDTAPDASPRRCLGVSAFPLKEPVLPHPTPPKQPQRPGLVSLFK